MKEFIERALLDERQKNRSKIPYIFVCSKQYPGKFMLAYLYPGVKLRVEYMSVTHEGFRFRSKMHRSFNELISWFKLHFNDPLPAVQQKMSTMSVTANQQQPPQQTQTQQAHNNNSRSDWDMR